MPEGVKTQKLSAFKSVSNCLSNIFHRWLSSKARERQDVSA